MKRVGNIIRDLPHGLDKTSHAGDDLLSDLVGETSEGEKRPAPALSVAERIRQMSEASLERSKRENREARIETQEQERKRTLQEARTRLCLQLYTEALPEHYRGYVTRGPVRTAGTAGALDLIGQLEPGRSLHIWGEDPGNQKSHLTVWAGAEMIRRYGLRVVYLSESALERMAYDFDEPPLFEDEEVIVADDIDKVTAGERQSKVVSRLLGRPHKRKTLLSSAQRSAGDVAAIYERDTRNLGALTSRLYYLREVEVTGPDFRAIDGPRSWSN